MYESLVSCDSKFEFVLLKQILVVTIKNFSQISNFRRVLNAVCFLLGNSPASEFDVPTFRNTLFSYAYEDGTDSVPKRWHIKFRRRGITQKNAYSNFSQVLVYLVCFLNTFIRFIVTCNVLCD
jgi:hypothetical protein